MKTILLHFLIYPLSLALLTGCKIDGEEEITLMSDGSGDMRVHLILPYKAFSKQEANEVHTFLNEIVARHPELSLLENESCPYGSYCQAVKLHIGFDSVLDLERIALSEKAYFESQPDTEATDGEALDMLCAILGDTEAGIHPWGIDYHRTLDLSPLFNGRIKNGAILGDAEFRYILNTPLIPDSHNASSLDPSSGKLVWNIPLKKHFDQPFIIQANYARNEAKILWLFVVFVSFTVLFLLYKKLNRRGQMNQR
ncbi:MAG: hypothetical protein ABGY95_05725 [Rubritalea sp.]|uniref:hypothetical protein n=1 Tax=Rubritalea sp. TaxID=2109375 RepID=UPI003242EC3E